MKRLFQTLIMLMTMMITPIAHAEKRIALIVGNGQYSSVAALDNPVNDAKLMANSLASLEFDVTLLTDATQISLKRAIAQFGRDLRANGPETVGLFYYAGHGVQSFGTNYLLPVDATLTDAADLDLVALEAAAILRQMRSARNHTNIVILDACRNNPFETISDMDDNGLAEMKAPTGTYLAYATAPGSVAMDGVDGNSPFTKALSTEMQVEGAAIEEVFKNVRVSVLAQSGGQQTPWDTSSMTTNFVFKAGNVLTDEEVAEQQLWQSVMQSGDAVQVMLFLRTYPDGRFEHEARNLLKTLMAGELEPEKEEIIAVAPKVETPKLDETHLIETARNSGLLADYEAYLSAFPSGVFAELAKLEVSSLKAKAAAETSEDVQHAAVAPEASRTGAVIGPVLYSEPLTGGAEEILGLTISEVVALTPTFSPIEGLPEELWKDQPCSNCHEWTREALCTQATTYMSLSAVASLKKKHPFGGTFKENLKSWAAGGCN